MKRNDNLDFPKITLKCFISMKYGLAWIDPVYDIIERACNEVGLICHRSDTYGGIAQDVLTKVYEEIDESFIVVCDASVHSWFVAFELAHAIKHKPYILIVQDQNDSPYEESGSINESLSAQTVHIKYTLTNKRGRLDLENKLKVELSKALEKSAIKIKTAAEEISQLDNIAMPRGTYVKPTIKIDNKDYNTDQVWEEWIQAEEYSKPIVLTSPSGFGKTAFIAKFKEQIRKNAKAYLFGHENKINKKQFHAIVNVIELGMMRDQIHAEWPDSIFRIVFSDENKKLVPFNSLCKTGLVYLLLDGIDEYGLKPGADLSTVIRRCHELSRLGIKVMLACRSWFWDQRMSRYRQDFNNVAIKPFDDEQVKNFLGDSLYNRFIKQLPRGIPKWLRSALMLTFIREAKHLQFTSKTDLYSSWVQWIAQIQQQKEADRFSLDEILSFHKEIAFLLAQKRDQEIDEDICKKANRIFNENKEYNPLQPPTSKFLEPKITDEKPLNAKFFHHSLYEFFVAMRLADDFHKAVSEILDLKMISNMAISNVDLDFFTSSVYGYLYDVLGKEYERNLLKWLGKLSNLRNYPESLARNLVEYIGMTSSSTGPLVMNTLLRIIKSKNISEIIRYNAARALERIHPSAPRPHFDYTSDWGVADFGKKIVKVNTHAIRGVGRKEREPGEYGITFFKLKFESQKHEDNYPKLRKKICNTLLNILEELIISNKCSFLQINCSHAIVRWHEKQDKDSVKRIQSIIRNNNILKEVKTNLDTALNNPL